MSTWSQSLVDWYNKVKRDLPWRHRSDAYGIWISEIMLQQTQVDTVIDYYNRFLATFPTVHDLAKADEQQVLKLWEGLGYYSRARNLHKTAKIVSQELDGHFPTTYEALQKLPGLGPYTAAAVVSIAFGVPVPVVDGNVLRVFTRFWEIEKDIRQPRVRTQLFNCLTPAVEKHDPSTFNQAMMELGALICTPKSPDCTQCPIQSTCIAKRDNKVDKLPIKSKAKPVPHYHIGVGVILNNEKVLIGKRKTDQMLGGLWEFPGGKQEKGETIETTIQREIKEETTLNVTVNDSITTVKHAYSHFKITLHAYWCTLESGQASPKSAEELRWVSLETLSDYPFPKANKKVLECITILKGFPLAHPA